MRICDVCQSDTLLQSLVGMLDDSDIAGSGSGVRFELRSGNLSARLDGSRLYELL